MAFGKNQQCTVKIYVFNLYVNFISKEKYKYWTLVNDMHTEVFRRKNSEVQFTLKFIEKLDGWMDGWKDGEMDKYVVKQI